VFPKPALTFSNLSFCQSWHTVWRRGDTIPKILCKLNSLSRTELQQFCQQCLIACHWIVSVAFATSSTNIDTTHLLRNGRLKLHVSRRSAQRREFARQGVSPLGDAACT
jgi:hypothetical protein